tara:strand:+ start:280 stop:774 length:495 start_codon:yes stop_codon:yes gene_type:complete
MTIIIKNKETLIFGDFKFKCSAGMRGFAKNKIEGDKKTPRGVFNLGNLYFRKDRNHQPNTKIKCIPIKKNWGWSDDLKNKKHYNKLVDIQNGLRCEKLFRRDNKYDFLIPILYNTKNPVLGKGSAIFLHLTKNYKKTLGCIALKKKDFLILLKLINKKTKIKIV